MCLVNFVGEMTDTDRSDVPLVLKEEQPAGKHR
jgi:hypothetical protein